MATKANKGFGVKCPFCGSGDSVKLDLNALGNIECGECSETFSAIEARDMVAAELARWANVVSLVELGRAMLVAQGAP